MNTSPPVDSMGMYFTGAGTIRCPISIGSDGLCSGASRRTTEVVADRLRTELRGNRGQYDVRVYQGPIPQDLAASQ